MDQAVFCLAEIATERKRSGRLYREFLRVPSMSMGLYELAAGGADPQQPHREDEAYYVVSGKGMIRVADRDFAVEAGTTVFVEAEVEHHFHSVTEDLTVLVFFAPAESTT
jgi:mannose-6-phosphate isomerase-like protein (cupin superfamily)